MKYVTCFITMLFFVGSIECKAQDSQPTVVIFETTTPHDILVGAGVFIEDTGKGIIKGVKVTAKGLGEIISSPFKARIGVRKRRYLLQTPEIRISPGKLEEIKPPVSSPQFRAKPRIFNYPQKPLYYLPAPDKYRLINVA